MVRHEVSIQIQQQARSSPRNGAELLAEDDMVCNFPGGSVVKNPPANAGDPGSVPSPGRVHMLYGATKSAQHVLSPRATVMEAPTP